MRVAVVTPPAPVVSIAEAKAHLKVKHSVDDALITGMVAAATGTIDGPDSWLGRSLGTQILEARAHAFDDAMPLPFGPVIEVLSVKYLNAAGAEISLDAAQYELRGHVLAAAFGLRWPIAVYRDEAVRIKYRAGYVTLPAPIHTAILLLVGDLYRNRETTTAVTMSKVPMSTTVEALLNPLRLYA